MINTNLTLDNLQLLSDKLSFIVWINEKDKVDPTIVALRDAGYRIRISEHMLFGKAFYEANAKCGLIDLVSGEIIEGNNLFWTEL